MRSEIEKRAEYVNHMIKVMRTVNDEGSGVYDTWLVGGPPDGCSQQEIVEFVEDEEWYRDVCQLFTELISELIVTGYWGKDGYTREFFSVDAYRKGDGAVK